MRTPEATFTQPTEERWPEFFAMAEEYAPPPKRQCTRPRHNGTFHSLPSRLRV